MSEPNAVSSDLYDTFPVVDFDVHFKNGETGQFTLFEGDRVEPANVAVAHPTIQVHLSNKRTGGIAEEIHIYVENVNFTSIRRTTRRFLKSGIVLTPTGAKVNQSRTGSPSQGTAPPAEAGPSHPMSE